MYVAISLSPLPLKHTTTTSLSFNSNFFNAAKAWPVSSAGMMPSSLAISKDVVVVCLSGRGDKDMATYMRVMTNNV